MIPIRDDNPIDIVPWMTGSVIAACVLVFLWQLSLDGQAAQAAAYRFGVVPALLTGEARLPPGFGAPPPLVTIFSSMFMHGGFMHLAGNLLYLWIFGNNIEDLLGHGRFVVFYAACGVAAALAQTAQDPSSAIPMIGASGAISGVLGAYLVAFPRAQVTLLLPLGFILYTVRWPALWVLGIWFAMQVLSSLMANPAEPGVAFLAHIGGFLAGIVLLPVMRMSRK